MSSFSYEDFLREEQRFFRMFEEKVGIPMARAMFDAIDKAWDDAIQKANTNHGAVPEAKADLPDERPPTAVSANGGTPCAASRDGSGTGNTQEPVAWALVYPNDEVAVIAFKQRDAEERASASDRIVPLYRHPQPTLTDAERESVMRATDGYIAWQDDNVLLDDPDVQQTLSTLRSLLERLG